MNTKIHRRRRVRHEKTRLRRRRQELDISLDAVSAATGMHKTSVSRVERGVQRLPESLVDAFARAYRVEPGHMRWLAADALRSRAAATTEA